MKIINQKKFISKPDLILIDTDNTLYEYSVPHDFAMNEVQKKIKDKLNIASTLFFEKFEECRFELKRQIGSQAASHSRLLYFKIFLEKFGLGSQLTLALDLEQTYWRSFLNKAILFDGVLDFLDDLRILRIPIVIVTDLTTQIQFRKLVHFNIDQYFDYIVTSEEAGYDKPNKAPFELAIKKVQPKGKTFWMIGDNPKNDILGAKEAINAITIQKIHKGVMLGKNNEEPDCYFENFNDLKKILNQNE